MRQRTRGKALILAGMVAFYLLIGLVFAVLVSKNVIEQKQPQKTNHSTENDTFTQEIAKRAAAAEDYLNRDMVRDNGHIDLYLAVRGNTTSVQDPNTNSEAASYYLLWNAQAGNKTAFDKELAFMRGYMEHPAYGFLQWRLTTNDTIVTDGGNIASDADLRTIKALAIAHQRWPEDPTYNAMIDSLAKGIKKVAVTKDGYLSPYGGISGETSSWTSEEVWLSYTDFTALQTLSERQGQPWSMVYDRMKRAVLDAQLENGLYNTMLTNKRAYGNGIDEGGYSINSLWVMVRAAESGDADLMASANKSLSFYKQKFSQDGELYQKYGSDGSAMIAAEAPWVYALVGRAAVALGDEDFARTMLLKLTQAQVSDPNSPLYGAIPEGAPTEQRIGQFTMQESILTMQAYTMPALRWMA